MFLIKLRIMCIPFHFCNNHLLVDFYNLLCYFCKQITFVMNNRLQRFLDAENITQSQLAERLGVASLSRPLCWCASTSCSAKPWTSTRRASPDCRGRRLPGRHSHPADGFWLWAWHALASAWSSYPDSPLNSSHPSTPASARCSSSRPAGSYSNPLFPDVVRHLRWSDDGDLA